MEVADGKAVGVALVEDPREAPEQRKPWNPLPGLTQPHRRPSQEQRDHEQQIFQVTPPRRFVMPNEWCPNLGVFFMNNVYICRVHLSRPDFISSDMGAASNPLGDPPALPGRQQALDIFGSRDFSLALETPHPPRARW